MKVLYQEIINPTIFNSTALPNFYEVMLYGDKEILNYWNGYNNKLPEPICEVEAKVTGRIKVDSKQREYNNLTLIHKSIKFIYEQRN
jgi:hypothetical protein